MTLDQSVEQLAIDAGANKTAVVIRNEISYCTIMWPDVFRMATVNSVRDTLAAAGLKPKFNLIHHTYPTVSWRDPAPEWETE